VLHGVLFRPAVDLQLIFPKIDPAVSQAMLFTMTTL
jgi:hypothetical protein